MPDDKDDIRNSILEAAIQRFKQYGFCKTTVEEIAKDIKIRKANIYLYFKSKKDIIIAIIDSYYQYKLLHSEAVYRNGTSIKQRFMDLINIRFMAMYEDCLSSPHGHELAQLTSTTMKNEYHEVTDPYHEKMDQLLVQLIEEGNQQGLFDVDDPKRVGEHIATSFKIIYPQNMVWECSDEVRKYIETIVNLAYNGMLKRRD